MQPQGSGAAQRALKAPPMSSLSHTSGLEPGRLLRSSPGLPSELGSAAAGAKVRRDGGRASTTPAAARLDGACWERQRDEAGLEARPSKPGRARRE